MKALREALPLLCAAVLCAVFANAFYHQIVAIPQFVFVLQEWGFGKERYSRMIARGVIAFEFVCLVGLIVSLGTGLTASKRLGNFGWRAGRLSFGLALFYLQLTIIMYAVMNPLICGCGPLLQRMDGWIVELWGALGFAEPKTAGAVSIVRNVGLSLLALIGLTRERVKRMDEA